MRTERVSEHLTMPALVSEWQHAIVFRLFSPQLSLARMPVSFQVMMKSAARVLVGVIQGAT